MFFIWSNTAAIHVCYLIEMPHYILLVCLWVINVIILSCILLFICCSLQKTWRNMISDLLSSTWCRQASLLLPTLENYRLLSLTTNSLVHAWHSCLTFYTASVSATLNLTTAKSPRSHAKVSELQYHFIK